MSSNAVVELKGGMYTLMSLRLHSSDINLIDAGIADKVMQAPGFFSETPIVVDLSEVENDDSLDPELLLEKIRAHKLVPVMASVSDKDSVLARLIELPLVEAAARRPVKSQSNKKDQNDTTSSGKKSEESGAVSLVQGSKHNNLNKNSLAGFDDTKESGDGKTDDDAQSDNDGPDDDASDSVKHIEYVNPTPLLVTRPVRSGQQLYARDTDLIIMAHVGPGAEIVADNNIHVYGPLRGRALCGVTGNTESRIFCQSLEAELVSVAGNYKLLEEIPEDLRGKPAQIWLEEGRLKIEAI